MKKLKKIGEWCLDHPTQTIIYSYVGLVVGGVIIQKVYDELEAAKLRKEYKKCQSVFDQGFSDIIAANFF